MNDGFQSQAQADGARRALLAALLSAALLVQPSRATPPQTPYHRLEERAAQKGAGAVRREYRRQIRAILAQLEKPAEVAGVRESFQRTLSILWLFDFLRSWALVEGRDLRQGKTARQEVERAVLDPMLDSMEKGLRFAAAEGPILQRLIASSPPRELQQLGLTGAPESSVAVNRDAMLRQMAILAKLADARSQLERVFRLAPAKIGSASTAEELLMTPHDYETLLQLPESEKEGAVVDPLSEDDENAIRQVIADFWRAAVRRDAAAIERLYLDRAAAQALTVRLSEVSVTSIDLSGASFQFERLAPELVRVRVDNVAGVKLQDGRSTPFAGGKTFKIALGNGGAFIVAVGGDS